MKSSPHPYRILDYACPVCGAVKENVRLRHPNRPHCCRRRMDWIPPRVHVDVLKPMQEFMTTDTQGAPVLVESIAQIRKIEHESEKRHAEGTGQLLRWRVLSQDQSNADVSSIAKHLDRSMDDQEDRIEADGARFTKQIASKDSGPRDGNVPFSAGDHLEG